MIYFYTLLTLFCAFLYGASAVLCKIGLQHGFRLASDSSKFLQILALLKNWVWVAGVIIGIVANIAVIQIQSVVDISIVYPILNLAYVFTVFLGYVFLKERLNRTQRTGVVVITLGTLLILLIKDPVTGQAADIANLKLITFVSIVTIIGLIAVAKKNSETLNYEIMFAMCAGICFGSSAIFLKTNTNLVTDTTGSFSVLSIESISYFLTLWPFFMVVLFGVVGFVSLQVAYSRGHISVTVPLIAVAERVMNMVSGYFIFDEAFSTMKVVGFLTIILGAFFIVVSSLRNESETPLVKDEYREPL